MGMIKSSHAEIWKLEREIAEAELEIDAHKRALAAAEAELKGLWTKAQGASAKNFPPVAKAINATCKLITEQIPARIERAARTHAEKRAMQREIGIALHKYINDKIARARPGQILPGKLALYRELAEEMRMNFV